MAHQTTTRVIQSLGVKFDEEAHKRTEESSTSSSSPKYVLVGDNIDHNVSPCHMTAANQTKSFHHFYSYAVHDRVDLSMFTDECVDIDVEALPTTAFFPSLQDCTKLRENYIILAARVLVANLNFLKPLKSCVPQHIQHCHTTEMTRKSTVVCYDVLCSTSYSYTLINFTRIGTNQGYC